MTLLESVHQYIDNLLEQDQIKGGKADNQDHKKYNQKELKKGRKHEKEHTDDPDMAEEIASDHLEEDPKYYTRLEDCGIDE